MSSLIFLFFVLVVCSNVHSSPQVTLTCSFDAGDEMQFQSGSRKLSATSLKDETSGNRQKGQNNSSLEAIARLESQLGESQRGQRRLKKKQRRNEKKIALLEAKTAQLVKQLKDFEATFAEIKNNISVLQNTDEEQAGQSGFGRQITKDCQDLYEVGINRSGIYNITINGTSLSVYCDMESDGGGWTVFQRRNVTNKLDFNQNWNVYKKGFGNLDGDFWLGLDHIHNLTRNRNCKLRVDLLNQKNIDYFATYSDFGIADESQNYYLHASGHSGTAFDKLNKSLFYDANIRDVQFSTRDNYNVNDFVIEPCPYIQGGWWFYACSDFCLNCQVFSWSSLEGILQSSTMKFRCH